MNKISFFVVGVKGFNVLNYVIRNHRYLISQVICGRDSGVVNDYYKEIIEVCADNGIPYYDRLSNMALINQFDGFMLAIGWRWMLPAKNSLIIIHDSLLPKYRGFSPLVNCLINGESEIGATMLFASNEFDKGNVISQSSIQISYPIKISDAIDRMSDIYIRLTSELLRKIKSQEPIKAIPQIDELATYSLWRDGEDYWINWNGSSEEITRFVDAVGPPYAGARCLINDEEAIVQSVSPALNLNIADRKSSIGKVLFVENECPIIVCADGLLKIHKLTSNDGASLLPLPKFRTRFSSRT